MLDRTVGRVWGLARLEANLAFCMVFKPCIAASGCALTPSAQLEETFEANMLGSVGDS